MFHWFLTYIEIYLCCLSAYCPVPLVASLLGHLYCLVFVLPFPIGSLSVLACLCTALSHWFHVCWNLSDLPHLCTALPCWLLVCCCLCTALSHWFHVCQTMSCPCTVAMLLYPLGSTSVGTCWCCPILHSVCCH